MEALMSVDVFSVQSAIVFAQTVELVEGKQRTYNFFMNTANILWLVSMILGFILLVGLLDILRQAIRSFGQRRANECDDRPVITQRKYQHKHPNRPRLTVKSGDLDNHEPAHIDWPDDETYK